MDAVKKWKKQKLCNVDAATAKCDQCNAEGIAKYSMDKHDGTPPVKIVVCSVCKKDGLWCYR
jgi:hypothetical protein